MPLSPRRVPRYYDEEGDLLEHAIGSSDNAMLDAWESSTRVLLDRDLAPQLQARFERLVSRASGLPDGAGKEASRSQEEKQPDHLTLATVLATCRILQRFKLTADQHAAIGLLKTWLVGQMRGEPASRSKVT